MRDQRWIRRVFVTLLVFALAFLGLPFGPPVSTGGWPNIGGLLGWDGSTPVASAEPAPRRLVPPTAAQLGRSSAGLAKPGAKPARVRELDWERTRSSRRFQMSDGSTQLELSSVPLHYRDGKGKWRDIDTKVVDGSGQDAFANATNVFRSRFGKSTEQLASFESAGKSIALGVAGDERALKPKATGSTVTYPDVFGDADVRYRVSSNGLKEDIVRARESEVAEEYTFELRTEGLAAKQRPDGSIGFYEDDKLAYLMPAPFMFDSSKDNGLGQSGYSEDVTQTLSERGGKTLVTVKPDQKWLTAKGREYPVVIDPSITIAPGPDVAQDTLLSKGAPTNNYAGHSTLNVGMNTTSSGYRSLLKFDTSVIPADADVRAADLNLHFASSFGSDTNAVPLSAHEVTSSWSESTATWNTMPSYWPAHYYNRVEVDDQDTLSTSYEGPWKDAANANAVGGSMSHPGSGTTLDTFTWDARVPGPGDYKVEAHYLPYSGRGPGRLHHDDGEPDERRVDRRLGAADRRAELRA